MSPSYLYLHLFTHQNLHCLHLHQRPAAGSGGSLDEVSVVQPSDSFLELFLRYAGQLAGFVGAGRELSTLVDSMFKPKVSSKPHILEASDPGSFYPGQGNPGIATGGRRFRG